MMALVFHTAASMALFGGCALPERDRRASYATNVEGTWRAHVPGMKVIVPSNPADAGGLMLSAIEDEEPVLYMEHKLLADYWIDYLADDGRTNLHYDIPEAGIRGEVPKSWKRIPLGEAKVLCDGEHLTIVSVGVSVHRRRSTKS